MRQLQEAGYTREAQVQGRGQFSVRGAVVDIFSWDAQRPAAHRMGGRGVDLAARIRRRRAAFRADAQDGGDQPGRAGPRRRNAAAATLRDYLPKGFVTVELGEEVAAAVPAAAEETEDAERLPGRAPATS